MSEQEIADGYFAAMRAQDLEALAVLFDEAGVIVWPDGRAIVGKAAIRGIYARLFQMPSNNPEPGTLMSGPESFAVQVESRLPDGTARRTINVFQCGANGLIVRMDSYKQG